MKEEENLGIRAEVARRFIASIPHARALGLQIDHVGFGAARMVLPWNPALIGDPRTGVVHGGAVSTLMDTCCGAAVMSDRSRPASTATLDLRIDYMRGARPGRTITARAECYHVTRSVAFVRATADDGDPDDPVATANGAFTITGRRP